MKPKMKQETTGTGDPGIVKNPITPRTQNGSGGKTTDEE